MEKRVCLCVTTFLMNFQFLRNQWSLNGDSTYFLQYHPLKVIALFVYSIMIQYSIEKRASRATALRADGEWHTRQLLWT